MGAVKKLEPEYLSTPEISVEQKPTEEIPVWKKKKLDRQKLLRAIRAKAFSDTVRSAIRKELKKDGTYGDEE